MYKLVKTQYQKDGTRASSLTEYDTLREAEAAFHYEMWYANSQGIGLKVIILGENNENIEIGNVEIEGGNLNEG